MDLKRIIQTRLPLLLISNKRGDLRPDLDRGVATKLKQLRVVDVPSLPVTLTYNGVPHKFDDNKEFRFVSRFESIDSSSLIQFVFLLLFVVLL